MQNFLKLFLLPIVAFLLLISPVSTALAQAAELSPAVATIVVGSAMVLLSFILPGSKNLNAKANGIQVEFWVRYIIERLWKDNQFVKHAFNEDEYVVGGKVVHIPQPGAKPSVTKNRTSFPAAAVRRTDTDILYALDEYSTDPSHIQDAEKVELSYDKIDSILGDHVGVVSELVGDDMILKWLKDIPASHIIKTTGASAASTLPGTTGNRNVATHKDVRKANLFLNVNNVAKVDRFALLEENMADQIFDSLSENQYRGFTQYADAKTGVLGRLYGFDIMTRSSVAVADDDDAIKALGAVVEATDSVSSMFWQKNAVTRALGEVKFFEDLNNPLYYGDIYSALLRMGGRRRRTDNHGVVALTQATPV